MNSSIILFAASVLLVMIELGQSVPVSSGYPYPVISSVNDLSGLPVRNRRPGDDDFYICYPSREVFSYYSHPNALNSKRYSSLEVDDDDYFICYPNSQIIEYYNGPSALGPHRRSGEADRRYPVFDSYDARILRADRERANYKDSYGR